ncbi:MAG: bifunctional acetaldehyde-CoA/alcohol dehydrogenase [Clostridia bacterium]|nr:bifunctional acetaldehyde-CoA/alcohol dehydrogenase [Clostridia bacterium]
MYKREAIDTTEKLKKAVERVKKAQLEYSRYTEEEVNKIFYHAAKSANKERIDLAFSAMQETGRGVAEDKVIKNHYASEFIYNAYKDIKTCGIIEENEILGTAKIAEPVGVICAIIPVTNPTSTTIFKALISLKTRNGIIICPHPSAKHSTVEAAKAVLKGAIEAGAPEGIIEWVDMPSIEITDVAMKECDIILATGGSGMVKAAYSSGKPALGVGSGNTPAIIDESADIVSAVSSVIHSKVFDNGMICASEQAVIVDKSIYNRVKGEFEKRGCFFLDAPQKDKIRNILMKNGKLNPEIVGQSAKRIAEIAQIEVPKDTKILIGEVSSVESTEPFACEKLSPVLAMYKAQSFDDALKKAKTLIFDGGYGHTASLFIDVDKQKDRYNKFNCEMKACRIVINQPSAQGAIGDIYNFNLTPSLTLGCGSWGGNSVCENVGIKHIMNVKTVVRRRENMLWFRSPERIFIKNGCLPFALEEIKNIAYNKKVFIVTDSFLYNNGYTDTVCNKLKEMGYQSRVFFNVEADPTLSCVKQGSEYIREYEPGCIIALGGGSPMDAAKIMWLMYEAPETKFEDMAMRFADIRKRIYKYPKLGKKASFVAIPTTAGTGSEVTPFAVITDEKTGTKYPLADYSLMPDMAIIDPVLTQKSPKPLTAAAGIDALTHAIEAYSSMLATDYTDALALAAIKLIFQYLPRAYEFGENDREAREKTANAATMAGMAFANAFLGICHSMAHKLGAAFNLPHGISNALLIEEVMRFNASDAPLRMGTFPQYSYPNMLNRYSEIADSLNLGGNNESEKFELLLKKIRELKEKIGIKGSIMEYSIEENLFLSKLDSMAYNAFDDQCTGANPRYPLIEEIKQIYLNAYYKK